MKVANIFHIKINVVWLKMVSKRHMLGCVSDFRVYSRAEKLKPLKQCFFCEAVEKESCTWVFSLKVRKIVCLDCFEKIAAGVKVSKCKEKVAPKPVESVVETPKRLSLREKWLKEKREREEEKEREREYWRGVIMRLQGEN